MEGAEPQQLGSLGHGGQLGTERQRCQKGRRTPCEGRAVAAVTGRQPRSPRAAATAEAGRAGRGPWRSQGPHPGWAAVLGRPVPLAGLCSRSSRKRTRPRAHGPRGRPASCVCAFAVSLPEHASRVDRHPPGRVSAGLQNAELRFCSLAQLRSPEAAGSPNPPVLILFPPSLGAQK